MRSDSAGGRISRATISANRLAYIACAALVAVTLLGMLVPVYADELLWRLQLSRTTLDAGDHGLWEQCGASTSLVAPLFMQPMRQLSALLTTLTPSPIWLRIGGVAGSLLWIALAWRLSHFLAADRRATARALLFGFVGLGVLPFLLVWGRPEQPILLCLTAAVAIALHGQRAAVTSSGHALAAATAVVLLGAVALGYHPKGTVFLPIAMVAAFYSSRGRKTLPIRLVAVAALGLLALAAFPYWSARFQCPGDPILADHFADESLILRIKAVDFMTAARLIARALIPTGYIHGALLEPSYMADWLPRLRIPQAMTLGLTAITVAAWLALILLGVAGIIRGLGRAVATRRVDAPVALAATIFAASLAWSVTQINKNAYESALVLPLVAIAIMLVTGSPRDMLGRWSRRIAPWVVGAALVSQTALALLYAPPLYAAAHGGAYPAGQGASVNAFAYNSVAPDVRAAGRLCKINPRAPHVAIDDITYYEHRFGYRPIHYAMVMGHWSGSVTDAPRFLGTIGSPGLIAGCALLPPESRARARSVGEICCVPAQ